jgi:enoyl-CoA hydratase/carnithine racemase
MISVEQLDTILVVRFDRPDKRNALTPGMLASLVSNLDTAWSAHAIVLSGVGETFCSGFDLALCQADETALPALLEGLSRTVRALRAIPAPVIASAHGAAIAGGCALLSGCDLVVTNRTATLGYPVLRLGISPAVAAPALNLSVGAGPARARLLSGQLITGVEAHHLGLAHHLVDDAAQSEARAIELARELIAKPRHALAYTKNFLNKVDDALNAAHSLLAPQLDAALATSLSLTGTPEQRERLATFLAKAK